MKRLKPYLAVFMITIGFGGWFYDDFNRADGSPGSNYGFTVGSLNIVSNELCSYSGSSYQTWNFIFYTYTQFGNDQYAKVTYKSGNDAFQVHVRNNGSNTADYEAVWDEAGALKLRRWISPVNTTLWQNLSFGRPSPGDTLMLEAKGSTLKLYVNDAEQTSQTDTSITGGIPGVGVAYDALGYYSCVDDLVVGVVDW